VANYQEKGGLTNFQKYRKKYFYLPANWYDTDASRLSVRAVMFRNGNGISEYRSTKQDYDSNDYYVSAKSTCFEINNDGCWGLRFRTGVYSFHAVDHAGLQWRFTTSYGLEPKVDWLNTTFHYNVPWLASQTCNGSAGGWASACRGTGCAVCKEKVASYTKYFKNHPNCFLNETCGSDSSRYGLCNANCPAPTPADR